MTLADVCLDTTYGIILACGHISLSDYPILGEWHEKVKALICNYDTVCADGEKLFADYYKAKAMELK